MYKACIFDLDGTLIFTLKTVCYYGNKSLVHFGFEPIAEELYKIVCRLSVHDYYKELLRLGGCPEERIPGLETQIRDYDINSYAEDCLHLSEPYPGMKELIDSLFDKGIKLAVLTNKPYNLSEKVISHFYPGRFGLLIGQKEGSIPKPDPRALWNTVSALGLQKEECVYVGDTDVDMLTASAAGVFSVGVEWGYGTREALLQYKPNIIADKPEAIEALFN